MPYTTWARWCVTADRTRLVPEHDPEAAFLLAPAGTRVPDSVARRYGVQEAEEALFAARDRALDSSSDQVDAPAPDAPCGAEVQSRTSPPAHKMVTHHARKKKGEAGT